VTVMTQVAYCKTFDSFQVAVNPASSMGGLISLGGSCVQRKEFGL
jgi:hypothetical protein